MPPPARGKTRLHGCRAARRKEGLFHARCCLS
jgi:hypothetical protein